MAVWGFNTACKRLVGTGFAGYALTRNFISDWGAAGPSCRQTLAH